MSESSKKTGSKLKSVQTLMQNRNSEFGHLLTHARVLNRLDLKLATILEPALLHHCQVAEFRNACLILVCTNATYATRIRMISQQLLDSFCEEGISGIEHLEIRIAPVNRPQAEIRKRQFLSSAAIQALGRFAADSGDAEIQGIFEQIKARQNK